MIPEEGISPVDKKDEKKKNEIDLSFVPVSPDGTQIFDTEPIKDANGNDLIRGDGRVHVKEIGEPKTMLHFCFMALKAGIESDKDKGIDEVRKCMRLIRRLEKYGDKPIALKTDNWQYIRDRMLKVSPGLRYIVGQFDILIEGEPSDEELATL
jgi:hypothetical protein